MKKLFSFLGTTLYSECSYSSGDFTARTSRFVQTAIYEFLLHQGIEIDKVYVFLTKEAAEKNYEDYMNGSKYYKGLKTVWKELFSGHDWRLIPVPMKSGQQEQEQWELFEQFYELIDYGEEIYFDITYSFRSNPIIAILISNFARIIKNASIKRMLYGNFEPPATIVDITSMLELLDWTVAVDSFLRTGNPAQIDALSKEKVKQNKQDKDYQLIHSLTYQLSELYNNLATCRGQKFSDEIEGTFRRLWDLAQIDETTLPQFSKLVNKIEEKVSIFSGGDESNINDMQKMWGSLIWCYEHGLYQQCLTFMREHIITFVSNQIGTDVLNYEERECISWALQHNSGRKEHHSGDVEQLDDGEKQKKDIEIQVRSLMKKYPALKKYKRIADYRNNINHADMNKQSMKYRTIVNGIKELLEEIKPLFQKSI